MSHEEIALGLGITRPTLEKHCQLELSTGAYQKRLEVLDAMFRTARRGNVAAQKAYMQLTPQLAAPPQAPAKPPEAPVPEKLGKKEQAQADAVNAGAGTEWGTLLNPRTPLQ